MEDVRGAGDVIGASQGTNGTKEDGIREVRRNVEEGGAEGVGSATGGGGDTAGCHTSTQSHRGVDCDESRAEPSELAHGV